jgi:hypothetical protein
MHPGYLCRIIGDININVKEGKSRHKNTAAASGSKSDKHLIFRSGPGEAEDRAGAGGGCVLPFFRVAPGTPGHTCLAAGIYYPHAVNHCFRQRLHD